MKKKEEKRLVVPLQEHLPDKEYDRLKRIQRELMGTDKNYTKHHKGK